MKTIIHIDQQRLRHNKKRGERLAPITVKNYKFNRRCQTVVIEGPSILAYDPANTLRCGASLWIETQSPVRLFGEESI